MGNQLLEHIHILYEDDDIVAVDKPAGLMVHADVHSEGPFLTDWIQKTFPETLNVGEPSRTPEGVAIARPGIVHRLDRETSGALVIAKTPKGYEHLKKQFQARTVVKKYLAFVWGEFDEEFGTISRPIGRSGGDFRKWSAQRGARGEMRQAETYWTKIAEGDWNPSIEGQKPEKITLVEAEPKTGRTHQIRVHLSAIHHPVICDRLYAPKRSQALGFTRMALHARSIDFENCAHARIVVKAPLPEDFVAACSHLGIDSTSF